MEMITILISLRGSCLDYMQIASVGSTLECGYYASD